MSRPLLPLTHSHSNGHVSNRDYIKAVSLGVLILQNTALVLLMRYSRTVEGPMYSATTCVFTMEVAKVIFCLCFVLYEKRDFRIFAKTIHVNLFGNPMETLKMCIPAAIYAIQNNLLFVALSNLEAAVYQVTYQLKVLTTALFSVVQLDLQTTHAVKTVKTDGPSATPGPLEPPKVHAEKVIVDTMPTQNPTKGLAAVLAACFSSGFAGVYFEKVVKQADANIWIRNIQLGIFGAIFSLITVFIQDYEFVTTKGFFYGYNYITWLVVLMQAVGGLVVAMVVKYADNILKGFATSVSIILSAGLSFFISEFSPSFQFIMGSGVVMVSVYLYSLPQTR